MAGYEDRGFVSHDGLDLYARDYAPEGGERALPVVCLHGLTRNSADFEEVAPWIAARGRRVIAMDVRGRGSSAWDPQPMNYHPGIYAVDVLTGLTALGAPRAVFVGTSMGGLITMTVAAVNGGAVAGAVLNDVGPELAPDAVERIKTYVGRPAPVATWAEAVAYARGLNAVAFPTVDDETFWERFARRVFREDASGRPVLAYDPTIAAFFREAPTGRTPDLWPMFKALAAGRPILLIRGAISDLVPAAIAARMREAAPEMAYAEAPDVGHAPMLTEPAAREALAAFLDAAP